VFGLTILFIIWQNGKKKEFVCGIWIRAEESRKVSFLGISNITCVFSFV
jgi:hypothetical protein